MTTVISLVKVLVTFNWSTEPVLLTFNWSAETTLFFKSVKFFYWSIFRQVLVSIRLPTLMTFYKKNTPMKPVPRSRNRTSPAFQKPSCCPLPDLHCPSSPAQRESFLTVNFSFACSCAFYTQTQSACTSLSLSSFIQYYVTVFIHIVHRQRAWIQQ